MRDDNIYELYEASTQNLLVYTAVGTSYFAKGKYPWLEFVRVRTIGGGGGSGSIETLSLANSAAAAGGGGGGYAEALIPVASLGATSTIIVAAGGAGAAVASTVGNTGGTSQFGHANDSAGNIYCQALGGTGGTSAFDSTNTASSIQHYTNGFGGQASYGDIRIQGSDGTTANNSATGASPHGYGGMSGRGFGGLQTRGNTNNAVAGKLYGGGAKGAYSIVGSVAGAAGAQGIVILDLFG